MPFAQHASSTSSAVCPQQAHHRQGLGAQHRCPALRAVCWSQLWVAASPSKSSSQSPPRQEPPSHRLFVRRPPLWHLLCHQRPKCNHCSCGCSLRRRPTPTSLHRRCRSRTPLTPRRRRRRQRRPRRRRTARSRSPSSRSRAAERAAAGRGTSSACGWRRAGTSGKPRPLRATSPRLRQSSRPFSPRHRPSLRRPSMLALRASRRWLLPRTCTQKPLRPLSLRPRPSSRTPSPLVLRVSRRWPPSSRAWRWAAPRLFRRGLPRTWTQKLSRL
mmetsp:Transcript_44457/g.128694  ORF Transcript_44457/g.128694 Transcript_44457/m.128694 type:complete len:272 (-) Transcript_44457:424-1239(-)